MGHPIYVGALDSTSVHIQAFPLSPVQALHSWKQLVSEFKERSG